MSSLKRLRKYCYTMDYKFYYNDGKKFTPITRKEYKEKTGESDYIIDKLRNSLGPYQWNDYFFLVPPTTWRGVENTKPAPIDWKLINLVKYFIKNNFFTSSIEQGPWGKKDVGYIAFINSVKHHEFLSFIEDKFGKDNTLSLETTWNWDNAKGTKNANWYDSEKYGKKIIVMNEKNIYTKNNKLNIYYTVLLFFPTNMIKFMHKKLNLEFPDHSKAHKGNRIWHGEKN